MNDDPSKMYEFLEALNLFGPPPAQATGEKTGSKKRDKQGDSLPDQKSKKCINQCDGCLCVFCKR